jgi:hypothetical protein
VTDWSVLLSNGVDRAYYDEEDSEAVEHRNWHLLTCRGYKYAYCWIGDKNQLTMHRLVCPTELPIVHHKDDNGLNNRRANLEPMTVMQHQRLMRKAPGVYTSDLKGIHWEASRSKWKATIMVDHESIFLGRFDTEEEAYAARLGAERMFPNK